MKKPCKECPFRKGSPAGWIGNHSDVQEIIDLVKYDQRFPCHMAVNDLMEQESLEFDEAVEAADVCVGGAIFLNNNIKLSRNRDTATVQKKAGKSDEVFKTESEMCAHHRR